MLYSINVVRVIAALGLLEKSFTVFVRMLNLEQKTCPLAGGGERGGRCAELSRGVRKPKLEGVSKTVTTVVWLL